MTTEDRRRGKQLPTPVTPPDTICFTITVPNAVQYRAALLGQLNILGEWHTWDHATDGTNCADCEEAAQLWRTAIAEATFSDDCELDMSCDDIADCIETSEAVQDAINAQMENNGSFQQTINNTSNYGTQLSSAQLAASLTEAAGCDNDSLFGSVTAIVDQLNTNNVDFLEQLEIESNTIERASAFFAAIPLFETLPIDDALNFLDTVMGEIKENYEATYTTGLRDTYRCAIFCLALEQPECAITFDMLIGYFEQKLGASLDYEALFIDMVAFFTTGSWSGEQISDVMHLAQLAIWREASNWLGLSFRTLQTVGLLGANDNDHDWAVLPCGCGTETPNLDIRNVDSGEYNSVITFIGHPEGHPEQDIWTITSQTATSNAAYVGYWFREQSGTCMRLVSYTAPASECNAACINCSGGYVGHGSSHPFTEESLSISGNTRTPAVPNEGTVGEVYTFVLENSAV